ncbi:MAG: hypothetical protein FJW51_01630 [Actinobacteria bacterium]|nr:hypothetical protein [Actinomycetota bacterium]
MKSRVAMAFLALVLSLLSAPLSPVHAADDCGFGKSRDLGEEFEDEEGNLYYELPDGSKIFQIDDENYEMEDGTSIEYGSWGECKPTSWSEEENEGSSAKFFAISMLSDEEEGVTNEFSSILLTCEKNRLTVEVNVEDARSAGSKGNGDYRMDRLRAKKFQYLARSAEGSIAIVDTKGFMSDFLKAKGKVAFKIPTSQGIFTTAFPKGNLDTYRSKFAKAGCKF